MARLAQATWNPAGATPGGYMDPRVVIFHVTAGEGMAQPHDNLEWHFHVAYDGSIRQLVDTNQQAAANYHANPFAISIETEGLGAGVWTEAQLDSLVAISEWCMEKHPKILRQRCDRWDGSGFGYHVMFGAPGPWTPVAKSCPGPNRIRQFDEVLLPRILNQSPEDDMFSDIDRQELHDVHAIGVNTESRVAALEQQVAEIKAWARDIRVTGINTEARIAALASLDDADLTDDDVQEFIKALPPVVVEAVKQAAREGTG